MKHLWTFLHENWRLGMCAFVLCVFGIFPRKNRGPFGRIFPEVSIFARFLPNKGYFKLFVLIQPLLAENPDRTGRVDTFLAGFYLDSSINELFRICYTNGTPDKV